MVKRSRTVLRRRRRLKAKEQCGFSKCDSWKILHTNIRGFVSKEFSLHTILQKIQPNIVTINETLLKSNKKLNIPGYSCFNRNRQCINGGGIATCVKSNEALHTLKAFEGTHDNEILITRHSQFNTPINVVNIYGEVESRFSNDKIQDKWRVVLEELRNIESKGEFVVIIGDLNKHVGDMIEGNANDRISFGGQLVKDLIDTEKYVLVNATDKCIGGPFTRVDPSEPHNDSKKSVLELCIVSEELFNYVDTLEIDKNREFTPYRSVGNKVVYTDHYSIILKFKNIPLHGNKVSGGKKVIRWNTNKKDGWKAYKELTDGNAILDKLARDETDDTDKMMGIIDKELTKIKFKTFGKVKEKSSIKIDKEVKELESKKKELFRNNEDTEDKVRDIDSKLATTLLKKQREAFEKEMNHLRDLKGTKGNAALVFKLREKIVGTKAVVSEAVAIVDPESNIEVKTPADIRRASLQYCCELLTNRKPCEEFMEDIHMKEVIHRLRMNEEDEADDEHELTEDKFEQTYKTLFKRPGEKYKFIMRAGESLKPALLNLCKAVWKTERLPVCWSNTTLVQQYKGKGSRGVLDNYRHLHMKDEFPKFFGHLVVSAAKEKMIGNMSKFQIGTKPGHRAQEHIFVLKSVISLYMKYDKPIILTMWDVSKFFDRESLTDCMNEIYKNEIKGKLYRLLYEMNKNTRISVHTPVGVTGEEDTGEGLGQGTLEGAIVSAVNLDNGVNDFFGDSEYEVSYGDLHLQPVLYQDDVARLSLDIESTQMGNNRMETMAETKLLNFNMEKSCFIVFGSKKSRNTIKEKADANPIKLCGADMVQEEQAKYLGDQLCGLGLAESVAATVSKRRGIVTRTIYEIRAVIDDCRSNAAGGITAGIDIWEMAVIPMLTYNAECWQDISEKTINELDKLQFMFLKCLFAVGAGCPTPLLLSETGMVSMRWRILEKKLLFLHHVTTLPDTALAKQIYKIQSKLNLPGLVSECQDFLTEHDISDISVFTQTQWKKMIKGKIRHHNKLSILEKVKNEGYKKVTHDELKDEDFKPKKYLSELCVTKARLRFKIKSQMTPTVKMNFQSDTHYTRDLWSCSGCSIPGDITGSRDTQQHVLSCHAYEEFRVGKDLTKDKDIVKYFEQVIQKRLDET